MRLFFEIFIFCVMLVSIIILFKRKKNFYEGEQAQKKELENSIKSLTSQLSLINNEYKTIECDKEIAEKELKKSLDEILSLQQKSKAMEESQEAICGNAFSNYEKILEESYNKVSAEYDERIELLNASYSTLQLRLLEETDAVQEELNKIKSTRDALRQAELRSKEIKDNLSFYCLQISDVDKSDIVQLEKVKLSLTKPRILSMLIWSTYFQKPLKTLSTNVIGTSIVTGIYKITNIITNECYIGQATNVATRWSEHAKCGLGIDTPANNKLYNSMQEYGLYNFSWELLEQCNKELLNEKERYYIDLYDSYNYGYNSNKGVK